jgi:hypothetical protein
MKKIMALLAILLCCYGPGVYAQGKPNFVGEWYQRISQGRTPEKTNLFANAPSDFARTKKYNLQANINQLNSILRTQPGLLDLTIPYGGSTYTLNLARVDVTTPGLTVRTNKGPVNYAKGVQYRGIVNNNPAHIASISLHENDITGFFSTDEGNFVITKEGLQYIIYNDEVLTGAAIIYCKTQDSANYTIPTTSSLVTGVGCKTVRASMECDYAFYQAKGSSVQATADYVVAFFNQVATLYANENVAIEISEIFVWTQPDPYAAYNDLNGMLSAFRANKGTNYNGDICHLMTTRNVGGGVAYVDVLCNKSYAFGVSMVYSYYNNFPTYSWTIEVVTHEMGHNLGSPHTHSCTWQGGPLDNCYTPEGSCTTGPAPTTGGTVMSYCHMTSYGINFNNGFGLQPGNRIRDRVTNASCISGGATSAPSSLSTTNISSTSATLNWAAVSGATNYTAQYRPSTSSIWLGAGNTTGTSINLSGLAAGTTYVWSVKSDCSAYSTENSFATLATTATGCNIPAGLTTTSITESSAVASWTAVTGATSYSVQYKSSTATTWNTINTTSTSTSISGLSAGTSYDWKVKADCSSYSTAVTFITTSVTAPPPPSSACTVPVNLNETNVTTNSARLNWTGSTDAQTYNVRVRQAGTGKWTNYNNITGTFVNATGLKRAKQYEWVIESICTDGTSSGASSPKLFSTQ